MLVVISHVVVIVATVVVFVASVVFVFGYDTNISGTLQNPYTHIDRVTPNDENGPKKTFLNSIFFQFQYYLFNKYSRHS